MAQQWLDFCWRPLASDGRSIFVANDKQRWHLEVGQLGNDGLSEDHVSCHRHVPGEMVTQ